MLFFKQVISHFKRYFISRYKRSLIPHFQYKLVLWLLLSYFFLFKLLSPLLGGDIFFWLDNNGVKHYSNIKPPQSEESIQNIEINAEQYSKNQSNTRIKNDIKELKENNISKQGDNNTSFRVIKVYDGDSIKVKGAGIDFMVRLVGIDAPESGKRNQKSNKSWHSLFGKEKDSGQPFSSEAKDALTQIIGTKEIYIKSYGTDRYNRILGEVSTSDGTIINLEMVKLGMAEVYRGSPPKELDIKSYRNAESEAKRALRGIWSLGSNYQSPKEWRKEK